MPQGHADADYRRLIKINKWLEFHKPFHNGKFALFNGL
jgi:hypothetical protein